MDLESSGISTDDDEHGVLRNQTLSFDASNAPSEMVDTSVSSAEEDASVRMRSTIRLNTETSILNITEETDDEDEDYTYDEEDDAFILQDFLLESCDGRSEFAPLPGTTESCTTSSGDQQQEQQQRQVEETPAASPCATTTTTTTTDEQSSLMGQMIDNLLDNVCFSRDNNCGSHGGGMETVDMIRMLGCIRPPDSQEEVMMHQTQTLLSRMFCTRRVDENANPVVPDSSPHRISSRHRDTRVRRLLEERGFEPRPLRNVTSMRSTADKTKKQLKEDAGYDSDPEDVLRTTKQRSATPRSVVLEDFDFVHDIHPIVQSALNRSWNLTFHDGGHTPRSVRVWMERGTIVNGAMIEPRLMWRASQWDVPQSAALLHICRIRRCTAADATGLVQVRTSMILKAAGNSYVFQAPTEAARDAILLQWRITVARFATLAVMEDANSILREFFCTAPTTPYRL